MDLKLNEDGDLDITDGKASTVTGVDLIRQRHRIRLSLFRGEWPFDRSKGIPYYEEILGIKPFTQALAAKRIRETLLEVDGTRDVLDITFTFEAATRKMSVKYSALVVVDGVPDSFQESVDL